MDTHQVTFRAFAVTSTATTGLPWDETCAGALVIVQKPELVYLQKSQEGIPEAAIPPAASLPKAPRGEGSQCSCSSVHDHKRFDSCCPSVAKLSSHLADGLPEPLCCTRGTACQILPGVVALTVIWEPAEPRSDSAAFSSSLRRESASSHVKSASLRTWAFLLVRGLALPAEYHGASVWPASFAYKPSLSGQ